MSETFYIHDMEIQFDYDPYSSSTRWICSVTLMKIRKRFRFIDEAHQFRTMCNYMEITYPPEQVYREFLHKLARSGQMEKSEMAMYEEYFGTDDVDSLTERLKKRKQNQFEAKRDAFEVQKKERTRVVISKLGITFWGALIVEDILK